MPNHASHENDHGSRGDPRCSRRCPQLGPWAAEERVPELALSHSHTDEYLEYHHRTFVW
ncbi:hypothetical protein LEMLEM_LOCUS18362 [Lemmus lemmus]